MNMIRKCKYCGWVYDTKRDSQSYCPKNPNAKKRKPEIVKILCLVEPNRMFPNSEPAAQVSDPTNDK